MQLARTQVASLAAAVAAALALSATAGHAQVINTLPPEYNFVGEADQSRNDVAVGESFIVPAGGGYLSSLTLGVEGVLGTANLVNLRTYLYAWNGSRPTGPALFQSATFSPPATNGFVFHTFTPNVSLTPGGSYAFFVSGIGLAQPAGFTIYGFAQRGTNPVDVYTQGLRVNANTTSFADITSTTWYQSYDRDIAFRAEFTAGPAVATPEPASIALVATGLLAVGVPAVRRKGVRAA